MAAIATPRPCWRSAPRGQELVLAKPQTYMNDSGRAVRRLLQSYHVPLVDLLVVADDFALPVRQAAVPRGRVARRPQRAALDHRRPQQREVQPPPGRASASPGAAPSTTSSAGSPPTRPPGCRSSSMPPPRRSRRGSARGRRRRPTGSTPGSSRRPPRLTPRTTPTGRRRARWAGPPIPTACAGRRPAGGGSCRGGRRGGSREGRSDVSDRYRGRTTRQRNVADKVAREWAERRAAAEVREQATDLDAASAEAEVELLDPAARPARDGDGAARRPATRRARSRRAGAPTAQRRRPAAACRTSPRCRGSSTRPARTPRCASGSARRARRRGCTAGTSA